MSKEVWFQQSFPNSFVYSFRGRVKPVTRSRERQKRGMLNWCSPTDDSINGFVDNLRKYCARQRKYRAFVREIRKIRVERALLPSFAHNFFPPYGGGRKCEEKREASGKIGNGSTFLGWMRENSHLPTLFYSPRCRSATISFYQKPRCIAISLYSSLTQLDFWICASDV